MSRGSLDFGLLPGVSWDLVTPYNLAYNPTHNLYMAS